MAHPIPVQATVSSGYAPLDSLVLDLMWVTQDGRVAKELGRYPVTGGVAEIPDLPLPDPQLRWAIRISDLAAGVPVYRSGAARAAAGPPPLPDRRRPRAHPPWRREPRLRRGRRRPRGAGAVRPRPPAARVDIRRPRPRGSTRPGRYRLTFHGRWHLLPIADVAVAYRRSFGIAPSFDAGTPRKVAVAFPQGPWDAPPVPLRPVFLDLDRVLAAGIEAQMTAMGFHIGLLMLLAEGVTDFTPQTVSLTSIALEQRTSGLDALVVLTSGALAGGIRVFDPSPPIVAA